jgi:hypothetical protein
MGEYGGSVKGKKSSDLEIVDAECTPKAVFGLLDQLSGVSSELRYAASYTPMSQPTLLSICHL